MFPVALLALSRNIHTFYQLTASEIERNGLNMAEDKYYDLVAQIQELKVEIMAISDTSMSFTEARKSIFSVNHQNGLTFGLC